MGQITRLLDYETTRPPLSLLNVSEGFQYLLKSALVPPKQPPTHYPKMEPHFWTVVFCVVPVVCAVGTRAELASKNQDLRDVETLPTYYFDPGGDLLR